MSDRTGPRWVEVEPARMARWLAGFAERHGEPAVSVEAGVVTLVGADGAVAQCHPPPGVPAPTGPADLSAEPAGGLGLLLVRRGGYAVGLVEAAALVASKVDSRYVQSRTAAGGWSQQRFARRRDNQAKAAAGEAADECARLLLPAVPDRPATPPQTRLGRAPAVPDRPATPPQTRLRRAPAVPRLDALVTGGDRQLVEAVLADPRLGPLRALRAERFLAVPDPKRSVLEAAVASARAVRIRLS